MTKIGADVNGKPADPGSAERGVVPPVVLQPVPEKKSTFCQKLTIAFLVAIICGLLIGVIILAGRLKNLESHHQRHHHHHHGDNHGNHGDDHHDDDGDHHDKHYDLPEDTVRTFRTVKKQKPEPVHTKSFTKPGVQKPLNTENFTFEDMFSGEYAYRTPFAQFVGRTNKVYYFTSDFDLVLRDLDNGTVETLLESDEVISLGVSSVVLSADERYMLLPYDSVSEVQDGLGTARYRMYDREAEPGSEVFDFPNDEAAAGEQLIYAGWVGQSNALSYIFEDDLYYQTDPYAPPARLTTTGEGEGIRNGMSFWNYGGVLWDYPMYWFSGDQTYLVYGHFDSSDIPLSQHPVYGEYDRMYPYIFRQVYLKSGDPGRFSTAELRVLDLTGEEPSQVLTFDPPEEFRNQ